MTVNLPFRFYVMTYVYGKKIDEQNGKTYLESINLAILKVKNVQYLFNI